jgi:RES domain-containing protein
MLWRVGDRRDPLGFPPRERCAWSHRFDDARRRWRTIYAASTPETALREVLRDLRPSIPALARFVARHGAGSEVELPRAPLTRAWREAKLLAPARIVLEDGARLLDLTDVHVCRALEERHAALLQQHGVGRLDLHEITTRRRELTCAIATWAYDEEGVGVVRYPSSIDLSATPCYALIEGRARLEPAGDAIPLTDPPPPALEHVAAGWGIPLAPAPAAVSGARRASSASAPPASRPRSRSA